MPVIHRPNSDNQRVQALGAAKTKADSVIAGGGTPAFSAATQTRLDAFLPNFSNEINQRGAALSGQSAASAMANPARATTRMFISHFFQVFNLGVKRGLYQASERGFYNLAVSSERVPTLDTDMELIQWATNIIDGDAARVTAGGAAMANPSAADVEAQRDILQPLLADLTSAKDNYDNEQEDVAALRAEADDIIADVWDEVLFTFRKDEAPSMRRKAREYGVVYRLRSDESPQPDEYSVLGTVTNASGTPLADVTVTVQQTNYTVNTDDSGQYLLPLMPAAQYDLEFAQPGYLDNVITITVIEGEIITVDTVLEES